MFTLGRYATILGGITGVLVTLALLTLPLMGYCSTSMTSTDSQTVVRCEQSNLIASQGGRLEFVTIAYLVAMTGIPAGASVVAWRSLRPNYASPVLLLILDLVLAIGMLIAGFSIGFFYAPAVLLILLGAFTMLVAKIYSTLRDGQFIHNR